MVCDTVGGVGHYIRKIVDRGIQKWLLPHMLSMLGQNPVLATILLPLRWAYRFVGNPACAVAPYESAGLLLRIMQVLPYENR